MKVNTVLRSFFGAKSSRTITRKSSRYRPMLELLEDRLAPATFTVTTNADSGIGSLRAAIVLANADAVADTISFAPALTNQTIALTSGELAITNPVTIAGLGSDKLTIDAANASRIFNIDDGAAAQIAVSISGLKLTHGRSSVGGGISNNETLTLTNSTLSDNSATNGNGGGIRNVGTLTLTNSTLSGNSTNGAGGGIVNFTILTLTNSTLSGNSASSGGGGIFNFGTLTLTNSTLSGNSGTNGSGGGILNNSGTVTVTNSTLSGNSTSSAGGGIFNIGGTLTVTNSTLSGNSASGNGGGIFNSGTLALTNSTLSANSATNGGGILNGGVTLTLTNSTLSGNSASVNGGGINNTSGTLTLTNSTIVANRADSDNNASGVGGGINNASTATLFNTIVAGNVQGAAAFASDIGGTNLAAASAFNLIGDPATAGGLTSGNNGNIVGKNGVLLPLAEILDPTLRNNGGATLTHALVPGSAAIDAGNTAEVAPPATSEVQTVTLSGTLSGTYTLTFNGQTTAALTGNSGALAGQTQTALNNLSTIGGAGGSVAVGLNGSTLTVTFGGFLANTNVAQMTALFAGGLVAVVATTTNGHPGLFTDQRGGGFTRVVGTQVDIGAYEMPRALFTDDFNRTPGNPLGAPWTNQFGGFGIAGSLAQGNTLNANIATLAGFAAADIDLYADVNLATGVQAGLIARFTNVSNHYTAIMTREASGLITARLVKFVGGVYTELAVAEGTAAFGKLRLRVVGATLQMFLNGSLLASAIDFSLAAGSVGMRTFGNSATLDNFQAWPITTGVDNIDLFTHPDNTTLSDPWTQAVGFFHTLGNQVQGGQALNLAVLNGVKQPDVDVQASVSITGLNHTAALLARYQGNGDANYYLGKLTRTSSGFTATVLKNVAGAVTTLATTNITSSTGKANLRFLVTGSNLKFFVNNVPVTNLFDSTFATGSVGIRSDQFSSLDDFHAAAVTTDSPFADNFNQADATGLGVNWTRRAGDFKVMGNTVVGTSAAPAVNLATLVGVLAPSVEVQANVSLTTTGNEIGLVACYSGTADTNYYMARVLKTAAGFNLSIVRNVGGIVTTLKSLNVATLTGAIKLRVEGMSLTLFMNNVVQLTTTDSSLNTGSAGIRSIGTGTIDNFAATAVAFLPFTDAFPSPSLSANWIARAGGYTTSVASALNKAKGTAALNLATLGRLNLGNVDVQALIDVPGGVNSGKNASLVARYSGTGDTNMYLATVTQTGTAFVASISKKVNGVSTTLASSGLILSGTGTLRFTVIGGLLKLSFGATELSVFDFSLNSGSVGIRSSLDPTFDDFLLNQAG